VVVACAFPRAPEPTRTSDGDAIAKRSDSAPDTRRGLAQVANSGRSPGKSRRAVSVCRAGRPQRRPDRGRQLGSTDPLSTQTGSRRCPENGRAPNPPSHEGSRPRAWSVYGAKRTQPVAIGGKCSDPENGRNKPKPLLRVATGCAHGKEGVDGSSPSEGSAKAPEIGAFSFSSTCRDSFMRWVWSRLWSFRVENALAFRV